MKLLYRILAAEDNFIEFDPLSKSFMNSQSMTAIQTIHGDEHDETRLFIDTDHIGWSQIDLDDINPDQINLDNLIAAVTKRDDIVALDQGLHLKLADVVALKIDEDQSILSVAVSCAKHSPQWYRHPLSDVAQSKKLLNSAAFKHFVSASDGYAYNTDHIRLVQTATLTHDDLDDFSVITTEDCEKEFFGEDNQLELDVLDIHGVFEEMTAEEMESEADNVNDAETDQGTVPQEPETINVAQISLTTNNTIADHDELDQSLKFMVLFDTEKDLKKFMSKVKSQPHMVGIEDDLTVNARALDYSVSRYKDYEISPENEQQQLDPKTTNTTEHELKEFDVIDIDELLATAFIAEPEIISKPSITLYFNNLADHKVGPIALTAEQMKSLPKKIAEASNTITHNLDKPETKEDYVSVTINTDHLVHINAQEATSEEPTESDHNSDTIADIDIEKMVDVTYSFDTLSANAAEVEVTLSPKDVPALKDIATELGLMSLRTNQGNPNDYRALKRSAFVAVQTDKSGSLTIKYASGASGTKDIALEQQVNDIKAHDVLSDLSATGHTETILSNKTRSPL